MAIIDDSLKGILVAVTVIALFITCVVNFIVIFPQEQGVTFTGSEQSDYLMMQTIDTGTVSALSNINNQTGTGFDQWDVTQGFMGSNSIKQSSQSGINDYSNNIFTNLNTMAKQLFGANSPVIYVLGVLLSLTLAYIIYMVVKFVRQGN